MVLYCGRGEYIVLSCSEGCFRYFVKRCPVSRMCINCGIQRRNVLLARLHSVYNENRKSIRTIVLWTIGTNMQKSPENLKTLSIYWKYFRARMNKGAEWNPLFRVVETGSRGKRLHIHFLNNGFLSHKAVLRAWREVTRQNSNVNFTDKNLPPKYALRYAAKYLTKDASKFTFLGLWYGQKEKYIRDAEDCEHGRSFIYYNTMYDKTGIVGQKSISDYEGYI